MFAEPLNAETIAELEYLRYSYVVVRVRYRNVVAYGESHTYTRNEPTIVAKEMLVESLELVLP